MTRASQRQWRWVGWQCGGEDTDGGRVVCGVSVSGAIEARGASCGARLVRQLGRQVRGGVGEWRRVNAGGRAYLSASSRMWVVGPRMTTVHASPRAQPEKRMTLSSPIITSSISLQCPHLTISGWSNVDTISAPSTAARLYGG